jgi:hypothetical protein
MKPGMSDLLEVTHLMRLVVLGISASVIYICVRRFAGRVAARLFDWAPVSRRDRVVMAVISTFLTTSHDLLGGALLRI